MREFTIRLRIRQNFLDVDNITIIRCPFRSPFGRPFARTLEDLGLPLYSIRIMKSFLVSRGLPSVRGLGVRKKFHVTK